MDTNFIQVLVLLLCVLIGTDAQRCSRRWRRFCRPNRCNLVMDGYGRMREGCLTRTESLLLVKAELGGRTGPGTGIRRDYPRNPALLPHGRVPGVIDIGGGGRHIHVPTAHDRQQPIQLHINIDNNNTNDNRKINSSNVGVSQAQVSPPTHLPSCIPCGVRRGCPHGQVCVVIRGCPTERSCRQMIAAGLGRH